MPHRIIRDGLLDSERYVSLSSDTARMLFVHICLLADDFGCVSLAPVYIKRRCFSDLPSTERLDALLAELANADLIRRYESENGAPLGFIPRFRQRLQRHTLKHPRPPDSVLEGDLAIELFEKNQKPKPKSNGSSTVGHRPEVEVEVEVEGKGSEEKGSEVKAAPASVHRSAVDIAAALAEKMLLRESRS